MCRKLDENGFEPTKIQLLEGRIAGKSRRISHTVKYDDDRGELVDKREVGGQERVEWQS